MTKNTALFPCKPNFLGIGVAKAGTTTIASLLGQHPEISFPISDQKELHYFDEKYTKHSVNWYLNQFHSNIAVGEFTPSYLFVPEVRDRIYHELGPSTKFIVALRNPVDRAFAHYSHAVNNWFEKRYKDLGYPTEVLGFEAALQQEHLRLASNEFHIRHLSYFSKGLYARQLKWYFQVFDQKNFYVYLLEEYIHTPQKVLRDLCEFLGVDSRLEFTGINKKLNSQTNLALDPLIRSKLTKKYEESIRELEVLLGRDLSVWRDMDEKKRSVFVSKNVVGNSLNAPIFIVGSPRSGTTLLQCMLAVSNETFSLPETHFFLILASLNLNLSSLISTADLNRIFEALSSKMAFLESKKISKELQRKFGSVPPIALDIFNELIELYRPFSGLAKNLRLIEKTPFHILHISEISKHFPSAKFVNLIRDPRDVVSSRLNMPKTYAFTPSVERYSNEWNHCLETAEDFWRHLPDKIYSLRYEDLTNQTQVSLQRVCAFLELDYTPEMLANFGNQLETCVLPNEVWKNDVKSGQIKKNFEVWRDRITIDEVNSIEAITQPFMKKLNYPLFSNKATGPSLPELADQIVSPILVFQMGKVGSSSVFESLKYLGLKNPIFHIHYLSPSGIEHVERSNSGQTPRHILESRYLRNVLEKGHPGQKWKIVSLVREPITRNISAFFQNIDQWYPNFYQRYKAGTVEIEAIIKLFLEKYPHNIPLTWFDSEMKSVFDIDVFSEQFPMSRGYKIFSSESADLLLIKLEHLDRCASEAFETFLQINKFPLLKANISRQKEYYAAYKEFTETIRLPETYLKEMYNSKYAQHFYVPSELDEFRLKWLKSSTKQPSITPPVSPRHGYSQTEIFTASNRRLAQYKNKHLGQRCVIIGNGPSLNKMDLSFLKNEITFGMNRIYLGFEKWDFTPTYYVSVNPLVIEQSIDDILKIPAPKFLSHKGIPYVNNPEDFIFLRSIPRWFFAKDPRHGICEGYTVTYVAMQLAYFMGFSEVVLIGVDHSFATQGEPNKEVLSKVNDQNHFHPEYFGKGVRWQLPDLRNSEVAYELAIQDFEADGRSIVDATVDGKLTIFPKIDYRKFFNISSSSKTYAQNLVSARVASSNFTDNPPQVSAIISTYNAERFMRGRLQNLVEQTLYQQGRLEIIVIDSHSPQNEGAIVQEFQADYANIRYIRTDVRETVYGAWNRGIKAAQGQYVINANTDDRFALDALERMVVELMESPTLQAVYGDWLVTQTENDTFESLTDKFYFNYPDFFPPLLLYYQITSHAAMFRREIFDVLGYFDEEYKVFGDRDFMIRFALSGLQAKKISGIIGLYLENPTSLERASDTFTYEFTKIREKFLNVKALATLFGYRMVPDQATIAQLFAVTGALGKDFYTWNEKKISDFSFAGQCLLKALKHAPNNVIALNNLAIIFQMAGNRQEALNLLERALSQSGNYKALIEKNLDFIRKEFVPPLELDWIKPQIELQMDELKDKSPVISIIIPCYDRPEALAKCLDSLKVQTLTPDKFEVICVNDGSSDSTIRQVIETAFQELPGVYLEHSINRGRGQARNTGLKVARGQYLLFMDSDIQADPRLLEEHVIMHQNQSAKNIALLSKIDYPEEMLTHSLLANIFNQTTLVLAYSVMKPGEFYDHLHFYTGCISIPRQAFEILGGFDETYQTYGVEDTEYGFRLEKAGYQILYHPAAHCIHLDKTPTIEDFCNRQRRIATNLATFFHAHPEALELTRWSGLQNLTRTRLQNHLDQIKPKLNQILSQVQQIERIDLVLLDEDALDTKQLLSATKDILFFLNDYYWNQGLLDGLEQYGFESFADFKTLKSEKTVKISVIIPTYNRSTTLKKCLDALTQQSLRPDTYEVIICDDGSTDDTAKIVSHFTAPFKLRYLSQSNKGPAAARNLGIKKAVGDYLLFMNDDTIAAPDLLLAHYQTHQNSVEPKISVLGEFKLLPEHNQSLFTHVLEQSNLLFGYTGMEAGNLYNYTRFYTCNLSLPRQAVIDVGSFDEDFTGPAAEDLDLGYRLQQQGYRVLYQPNCVAWHDHRITPEGFCKTHVTRGLGAVVLFSKHPEISDFKDITPHVVAEWRQQQPSSGGTVNQLLHQLDTFTEPLPQASALRQQQDVINQIAKVLESLWLFHYRKGILSSPWLNKLLETTLDFDRLASQDKPPKSLSPKVSVVIPCYNYAHYLSEAVDSVLSQTYQNFEVIIVNDGSTDNTDLVANQLITQNPKQHIRLIQQSNSGQPAIARNVGIAQAVGQYILCLDADDKLEPTFLEKTVSVLDGNPEISIAFTHIQHFGAIDSIWSSGPFALEAQIRSNNIPYCALYRREVFDSVGGYATNVRGYEDWDFWLNTLEKEWQGQLIPEPLFYYRKGHESVLGQANQNSQNLMAQIILNHPALFDPTQVKHAQNLLERDVMTSKKYRITYLITSILGVTGGNQTLLQHTNYLTERGHDVSIVTYTDTPTWFEIKARVIKVPHGQRMAHYVPPSDVVISTYFMNTAELLDVDAPVKIYFAQGDQYIFADNTPSPNPQVEALRRQMQELSKSSYFLPDIHFVANSHNLARTVEKSYGRKADAIIPACTDQTIFRPLPRAVPGSRWRILVVGPDTRGSDVEPLTFKGISDIKEALQLLSERFTNFTTIRMSNSPPDIFKDFPCEFYIAPPDEMKTFLYGTAHILVYASHYDSCPLPPQEAMAAGAAVICTATSGAMEYCVHEENSLLVPIKSPPEIAQAIERLITDPELREKLIQGGFTTAQEHPRERAWHKLETVIDRFVALATKFPDSSSWTPGIINRIEKPQENCFTYSQPVDPAHRHIQMSTVSTGDRANGHHSTQPSSQISSNNHKPIGDTMTHDGILDQMIASAQTAGHWQQAISLLQEAVKYAPPGPTQATLWNSLGYSFFQAEQPVEAEAAFQEGIRIEPQNMDLLKNLIDLYRQQDQLDKATEYLNRGLRIDPDDIEILLSLGECAIQLGAFDVAEMAFVRVKALAPETAGIDEILAELFGTGQSSNGSLNGTAPSDDVSIAQEKTNQILAKGQAALEANDLTGAAQEFAWVVAQYPDLAAGHMALGGALLALGQAEAAITPLRRVVELLPELAAGYNQLGVAYYRAGHQAEAESAFKQAHQLDPLDLEPCLNLIDLYRGQRHFGEARTMVEVASSINANHVEVQIATGLVNAEMGNFGEARHSLTKLEGVAPTHPGVTALRSLLNDQANQIPDLISQVETAQAAGNWPQAITLLKAALPQPSHQADPALWNSLGVSHFHAGQITEAETALTHGLKFDPNNLDLLSNLANLYLQQEQFDQATAYVNKALRIDPNHIEALIVLGHCCIRLNVFDTALTAFRRVAELAPGTEGVDLLVTELESMVAVSV